MSLEQLLSENTLAIRDLIAALAVSSPKVTAGLKALDKAPEKAPEELAGGKTAVQAEKALEGKANVPEATHSYDDVKAAIVALSGAKGRDAVVELLGKFNVAKGPELTPDQYDAFIADASALMA